MKPIFEYIKLKDIKNGNYSNEVLKLSTETGIPEDILEPLYKKYWANDEYPEPFVKLSKKKTLYCTPFELMFSIAFVTYKEGYEVDDYRKIARVSGKNNIFELSWFEGDSENESPFYDVCNILDSYLHIVNDFEEMYNAIKKYGSSLTLEKIFNLQYFIE